MSEADLSVRIASRYSRRSLGYYARGKIRTDPAYEAVARALSDYAGTVYDIGCGIGLLSLYLRERGFGGTVVGIDHDERKIAAARDATAGERGLEFRAADVREPLVGTGCVVMLDVLHYFSAREREHVLSNAILATAPGGVVVIRDAIRDDTLRYRVTWLQESFSRVLGWLRAPRLDFPSKESVVAPFVAAGFSAEVRPLWGNTPFNNYLFVFRRSSDGMTKA